jgi:two-component system cell cycle response regulator
MKDEPPRRPKRTAIRTQPVIVLGDLGDEASTDARETEKAFSVPAPAERDRASLTLMSGPNAGQIFALDRNECVIGRDLDAHVRIEDPSLSRRHAHIVRLGGDRYLLEDLKSTNGTFVGGLRVQRHELVTGDRIQLGPKLGVRFAIIDLAEEMLQRQLFESSTRDGLTHAFNRKYLAERLAAEVAHARRHKSALAVLLFDIDEFKRTNDTHGHLVGDAVLRAIADEVHALIRIEDVLARFGGEEFVILIRATAPDDAMTLAERMRLAIEKMTVKAPDGDVRVTVSIGVASLSEVGPEGAGAELLALADTRLFRAKEAGRNRVSATDST